MGRAKGVVLLPPSPLTCIIPCMLLNTVAVFIETFLIPAPTPRP